MGRMARLTKWLFQRQEMDDARARLAASSAWQTTCLRRADACLSLADSLLDTTPLPTHHFPEIVGTYRLACTWLLSSTVSAPAELTTLLQEADQASLLKAAGTQDALAAVRTVLQRTAFDDAQLGRKQLLADAELLQRFLHASRRIFDPGCAVHALWRRRAMRLALTLPSLALIGLLALGSWRSVAARLPKKPTGVAWRASSTYPECDFARHQCGGRPTDLIFHTLEEASPWVEFDLGKATSISQVAVTNIQDATYQDRAVPLLVEVSTDQTSWTQVARRDTNFVTWTATFPPTIARYVRLRVPRTTYFHLDDVQVR